MARSRSVAAARSKLFRDQLEVNLDSEGRLLVKANPLFARELRKVLRDVESTARQLVGATHTKTGRLRRSIHAQPLKTIAGGKRITGTVSAGSRLAPYARYVHEGSRAHVIKARKADALSFHGKYTLITRYVSVRTNIRKQVVDYRTGLPKTINAAQTQFQKRTSVGPPGRVTVRKVNHPGYGGDPFLNKAARVVVLRYGGRANMPMRN